MKPEEILFFLQNKGCHIVDSAAFSVTDGFPYSATAIKAGAMFVTVHFHVSSSVPKHTLKEIKQELPKRSSLNCATTNRKSVVTLMLPAKGDSLSQSWDQALRSVTRGLRGAGVQPPSVCPICNTAATNAYALHNGNYTAVHRACVEENCRHTVAGLQSKQQHGSYALGFVGALLGALVGVIPNFLSIFFAEYIIGYLCAVIPLASYGGYRLFRGKPTQVATAIILLCSVLQAFVLEQAVWYASIVKTFDIWPSVSDSFRYYVELFDSESLASLGQTFLFVGIGIIICFSLIRKTAASEIAVTLSVLETLQDKPGFGASADTDGEIDASATESTEEALL